MIHTKWRTFICYICKHEYRSPERDATGAALFEDCGNHTARTTQPKEEHA